MSKTIFLPRTITHVFIMLGSGCNFKCRYCLQQNSMKDCLLPEKINNDTIAFIDEIAKNNGKQQLVIQFYGGEPLLYYKQIKQIINTIRSTNIITRIITNGSLITKEMVDFFNANYVHIAVSWDGRNTKKVRDFDVFENEEIRKLLFSIDNLSISSVISAEVYPKELFEDQDALNKAYIEENNRPYGIGMSVDQIFDSGVEDKNLFAIDYDRVFNEMTDVCDRYYKEINTTPYENDTPWVSRSEQNYIEYLLNIIKNNVQLNSHTLKTAMCYCGNGYNVYNVDLAGNLYACHNISEKIGTIYDPYFKYLEKIIEHDNTKEHHETCKNCPVITMCNNGCKLISKEARQATYCNLKLAMFGPLINKLCDNQ